MSAFFAIPIIGDGAAAGRKIQKAADKVGDVIGGTVKHADDAVKNTGAVKAGTKVAKEVVEGHHLLPTQFKPQFEAAGLKIEDFIIPLDKSTHRLKPGGIHTGPFEDSWNGQWKQFFDIQKDRSAEEILEHLKKMRKHFKI